MTFTPWESLCCYIKLQHSHSCFYCNTLEALSEYWTCVCVFSVCLQMQMNVHCLVRRCVKEASVMILWAATSVTARLDRTTTRLKWSVKVRNTHSLCVYVCVWDRNLNDIKSFFVAVISNSADDLLLNHMDPLLTQQLRDTCCISNALLRQRTVPTAGLNIH